MNFTICLTVPTKKRNRTKYVDKYYSHHPNVPRFCSLMNMTSKSKNVNLAKFNS